MISIIIPTLNEESVIEKTLTDLKSGLTIPHEIIVTDGKSTDQTVEISRRIADIVVTHTGTHRQTIAEGRNAGAKASHGEFLAFMDADCSMPDPDAFFSTGLRDLDRPGVAAVVAWIRVLPDKATLADRIIFFIYNWYLYVLNNVFGFGVSGGEFQMMRRSDFEKVGGYNPKLAASEDVDLLNRLSKLGKIKLVRDMIIFHTGRRAHKIGWPKLLYLWSANTVTMMVHKRSYSKEWEPIR